MTVLKLAFLHTGEAHIKTFQSLVDELAPSTSVTHRVAEELLVHAQQNGLDQVVVDGVENQLAELSQLADVVVCTCSTIGAIAEQYGQQHQIDVQRIDRAMADKAVTQAQRILVLATSASTLKPTADLLSESANACKTSPDFEYQTIEGAWDFFASGRYDAYFDCIASHIDSTAADYDLAVLAQASMAPAAERCQTKTPILSSPRLGVQRALGLTD